MDSTKVKLVREKCDLKSAEDKKLPTDSFIVTYKVDDDVKYDIVRAKAVVDVFDVYYDKYKNVQAISWTKGIISPRTFDNAIAPSTKKKKRKQ